VAISILRQEDFMKILALSFSPRKGGNTETLLNEALKGARQEGAGIELYSTIDKDIKACDSCGTCQKAGKCHIQDDMQDLYDKLLEADGIIFGTPIYFYNMTAQAKTVIDRTLALGGPERSMSNKVGGVIAVAGSLGLIDAVKDLYFYMVTRQMLPANFVAAYGVSRGDVANMEKTMKAALDLGRQIVKIAGKKFEYPVDIPPVHIAYGTHTK
jgi:multimeric flavodoxin WrbA